MGSKVNIAIIDFAFHNEGCNESSSFPTMETGRDTSTEILSLQTLPPKYNLPSFDPHCLTVLAYCKFGGAHARIKCDGFSRWEFMSNSVDSLPRLIQGDNNEITSTENIIDCFRELNFGTDFCLSKKQCADAVAFIELMEAKLRPAVLHTYWLEQDNCEDVTREMYGTSVGLPSSIFYPRQLRQNAYDCVYVATGTSNSVKQMENTEKKIYQDAVECLTSLSDKMGSHPFIFGDTHTTVDAVMFGYLAPLLKIPFTRNRLKGHLENFQNLTNTVNYIIRRYFPDSVSDERIDRPKVAPSMDEVDEFPNSKRDTVIAAVFALTVLIGYAVLRAGFRIQIVDEAIDNESHVASE